MIPTVAEHSDELKPICLRYNVQRLDLFGSAATGEYHPEESDLDFVVEFQPTAFDSMRTPTLACWSPWSSFSENL